MTLAILSFTHGSGTARMDAVASVHDQTPAGTTAEPEPPAPAGHKGPYPPPANQPTQSGPFDIRLDVNQGARVVFPQRTEGR